MKLLDAEQAIRQEIFDYFGYVENWRVLPFDDARDCYWRLRDGEVMFAETLDKLNSDGNYYVNEIYTQRHLDKHIYHGKDYTMMMVDTHTDGNKFLQIFDNSKECNE